MQKIFNMVLATAMMLFIISCSDDGNSVEPTSNNYPSVKIGNQTWMTTNLDVTHYRNGDPIRHCQTAEEWKDATAKNEGAWCYYNNSDSLGKIFGKLYNWYAVNDSRGLAPQGWHVPTDIEWKELEISLGMTQQEADAERERGIDQGSQLAGQFHLWTGGVLVNNVKFGLSGFIAVPGGYRHGDGYFKNISLLGYWWTSTEENTDMAWYRNLYYRDPTVFRDSYQKDFCFSVRLLKD